MANRATTTRVPDVQAQAPSVAIGLSRVGVTGVEKVIRIRHAGVEQLFSAQIECFVDLGLDQKGAHMSRFEEVINEAIGEVILGESGFRAELLARRRSTRCSASRSLPRRARAALSASPPRG